MPPAAQPQQSAPQSRGGTGTPFSFENAGLTVIGIFAKETVSSPLRRISHVLAVSGEVTRVHPKVTLTGFGEVYSHIKNTEGMRGFWRGNAVKIGIRAPTMLYQFTTKDIFKGLFRPSGDDSGAMKAAKNIGAGGLAGVTSAAVTYPLSFIYSTMTVDVKAGNGGGQQLSGARETAQKAYKANGLRGFYRGLPVTMAGIFVYRGLYFGLYDTIRPALGNVSAIAKFAVGYSVTVAAGVLTHPLSVLQNRLVKTALSPDSLKHKSSLDVVKHIIRHEGARAFWRGAGTNVINGVVGGLFLAVADEAKNLVR